MKKAKIRVTIESVLPIETGLIASHGELRFFLDSECVWKRSVSPEQARDFHDQLVGATT